MPGIASAASSAVVRNNDHHFCNGTPSRNGRVSTTNGFWSKHPEELTYNQLQKFWSELSPQARQKLLRIDKQMVFEQARKNMYCSRCHGLLLEGFLQIVMYGKSLQQEGICNHNTHIRKGDLKNQNDCELCITGESSNDIQDPSVHPWGGLTTTRNSMLSLLDCYLYTTSLKSLQNVFDSGRARERERELLYPDACGGDGRGWVSQEMGGYGRVHGTRESCALHTARLSVETLVDFWSALGEETRRSLLRMKEEDFMERLMYRFDSKRFCRDCRKNVIREFKELKELKRIRRENRCTAWFCVADTAFQYQVSLNAIQADWRQTFGDSFSSYEYYEWAVGTGEGKSDILDFENVGLNGRVQVKGLDLSASNSCYITLRGWKMDGRCTELSVKAHALKGKPCVHCRLVVGDGFVSIVRGDNIRRFFEHAEEAEEDEDDESMDKDGNELDGEYSRPQKHAKSPELAREFLLDAATVIFKEQVEKAFREGTARQNAHCIFVCLSLKMLEERVHIACKEIITLEKQTKLLEEEEKEKREEEERKERKRTKEKEKKLRRKERQREKDKNRGIRCHVSNLNQDGDGSDRVLSSKADDDDDDDDDDLNTNDKGDDDVASETEEAIELKSLSSDIRDEEELDPTDGSDPIPVDHFNYSQQKFRKEVDTTFSRWPDHRRRFVVSKNGNMVSKYEPKKQVNNNHFDSSRSSNGVIKPLKNTRSSYIRNGGPKYSGDQYESRSCSCKPYYARDRDNCGRSRNSCTWDSSSLANKKVWEPLESHKKNSDYDTSLKSSSALKIEPIESQLFEMKNKCEEKNNVLRDTNTGEHETEVKVVNSTSSNSENCSSCLSEGDSITFSSHSHAQSTEFSSSDSEDTSYNSEGRKSLKTSYMMRMSMGEVWASLGSGMAGLMFMWAMYQNYFPHELQRPMRKYVQKIKTLFYPYIQITFNEYQGDGFERSKAYMAIERYLEKNSSKEARRLKANVVQDCKSIVLSMEDHEEVTDSYEGIKLWWATSQDIPMKQSISFYPREDENRYFNLTFHKKYRDIIMDNYLKHVLEEGKAITVKERQRKLYTNCKGESWGRYSRSVWSHVVFEHPATFDTIGMEPKKKQEIIDDLMTFSKGKEYYAKIGKAWKRGYLLYGPPGTGKSTMIAAMANLLKYDVYDLELTSVKDNTELRKLLIDTSSKSIIVIEDIDCSLDLTGQREKKKGKKVEESKDEKGSAEEKIKEKVDENKDSKVTLSGLLNFIDGLWSAIGGERITVFTTNYVEKLDPALIRRGRMDKHIELSYCGFEAFKVLAKNYLDVESHMLFKKIETLLEETNISPADVAENLMPKTSEDDKDVCLERLVHAIEVVKEEARCKAEKEKAEKEKEKEEKSAEEVNETGEAKVKTKENSENGVI